MLFFETSAKNGDGVNNMMYTCISMLPFFEQFKNDNKDNIIRDLTNANSISNSDNKEKKVFDINNDGLNMGENGENSSKIILKRIKEEEEPKKKFGC